MSRRVLVVGLGVTGRAVATALAAHGDEVVAIEDRPRAETDEFAARTAIEVVAGPDGDRIADLVEHVDAVSPSPGIPDRHPVFAAAVAAGTSVISEFDLAREWDDRPVLAITGTNGKTTVTELTTRMLLASGVAAVAAGNVETPLVEAIEDPAADVFVVEASSFRLGHTQRFRPRVATWLNFGPDHLDVHADLDAYEAAKASIWRDQQADDTAVVNRDDPVVMAHRPIVPTVVEVGVGGDYDVVNGVLRAGTEDLAAVELLWRALPHDCFNTLAAAATAIPAGASVDGIRSALGAFRGLPHRVELVAEADGVRWYDDSKATTPHAVAAAVRGFESVVLIAGGRNKGVDLRAIAQGADHVKMVVAIGEAAPDVVSAFADRRPTTVAGSMAEAVELAADVAGAGDVVLLSPGCASFDWYEDYGARGDEFARLARDHTGGAR